MTMKNAWIVMVVTCVIAIPVRVCQLLWLVDTDTGFFTDNEVTKIIVTSILALACVFIIFACRRSGNIPAEYKQLKSKPMSVFCVLVGGSMIVQALVRLGQVSNPPKLQDMAYSQVNTQHPLLYSCLAILCLFAAGAMIMTASGFIRQVNPYRSFPLLALVVPLWGCLDLAVLFVQFTEEVNTIESVYDMFMVIFQLLCLFAQAQLFVGIDQKKSRRSMFAYGLAGGTVAFVATIPNVIMYLLGRGEVCSLSLEASVMYLLMAVYLQFFLFTVYHHRPAHFKENMEPV